MRQIIPFRCLKKKLTNKNAKNKTDVPLQLLILSKLITKARLLKNIWIKKKREIVFDNDTMEQNAVNKSNVHINKGNTKDTFSFFSPFHFHPVFDNSVKCYSAPQKNQKGLYVLLQFFVVVIYAILPNVKWSEIHH